MFFIKPAGGAEHEQHLTGEVFTQQPIGSLHFNLKENKEATVVRRIREEEQRSEVSL